MSATDFSWQSLLGDKLQTDKDGTLQGTNEILGKFKRVGLYFSAHWCPPCRQFTPVLAEFHGNVKEEMAIVFISSDRDQGSFDEYFGTMPWFSLPFSERTLKQKLSSKYGVSGIPTFIVLGPGGTQLKQNGRQVATENAKGSNLEVEKLFPLPTGDFFVDTFGDNEIIVKDSEGKQTNVKVSEHLKKFKRFVILFSAHWCPPCKKFTPMLVKFYNAIKAQNPLDFEVVFSSADRSAKEFGDYYAEMPWAAVDYDNETFKNHLDSTFEVEGIPHMECFDANGKNVVSDVRSIVAKWNESGEASVGPVESYFKVATGDAIEDFFPDVLVGKDGEISNAKEHVRKFNYIAVYVASSSHEPCEEITKNLISFYKNYKDKDVNDLEIVLITNETDDDFQKFFDATPWISTGSGKLDLAMALKVSSIPDLYVFDKSGRRLGQDGKENTEIISDAINNGFPNLADLFKPL